MLNLTHTHPAPPDLSTAAHCANTAASGHANCAARRPVPAAAPSIEPSVIDGMKMPAEKKKERQRERVQNERDE